VTQRRSPPPAGSALDAALRALRHRDRSSSELRCRLAEHGYGSDEREEAIETLVRTGLADDARYAEARAQALAGRGAGDLRIRHDLTRTGIPDDLVQQALDGLEPEADRARSVVSRRGTGAKTARYLHGKGFSEDVIAGAVAGGSGEELG
jgi:regulatory protein